MKMKLWEILVPTIRPTGHGGAYYEIEIAQHHAWDAKVREITHGLTIMEVVKGQWVAPTGHLHQENMIPVRIAATRKQINKVIDMTLEHYDQQAVLCYVISPEVILKSRA